MIRILEKGFLVNFDLRCKPILKFLIQINKIYKRQKDSLRFNFHFGACELTLFQLSHDHENGFYLAVVKPNVRPKKVRP